MGNVAFLPIAPEIVLLIGALAVLMVEVTLKLGRRAWGLLAGTAIVAAFGFSVLQWLRVGDVGDQLNFSARDVASIRLPMVVMDHLSAFSGMLLFAVAGLAFLAAWRLVGSLGTRGAEFVALFLLAVAGLHLMTISSNLILLFIGLETASISLYVIAGFTRDQEKSDEAAMKYFLLGSFASAVFLYGVALAFAAAGSTSIYGAGGIQSFFQTTVVLEPGIALIAVALMIVGLGFKVSAAPFHQWAPDVYQGAPAAAVPMMSAGVKIAGFAALARILTAAFPALQDDWAPAVAAIAALSVVVGTLGAIAQDDLKRMLAFSGVAHAGFILTALVAGRAGVPGMWFYVATYSFQLVGAFTVAALVAGPKADRAPFDSLVGLGQRSGFLAWMLALFMLAMGGIPFTSGFVGKISVFTAAVDAGYLWLVIVGLVASVGGLFFYLRVIVLMFFQQPVLAEAPGTMVAPPEPTSGGRIVLGVAAAVTVALGLVPWPLLHLVGDALPF
jgi:NADH-quinone oxidoreductase subunit N